MRSEIEFIHVILHNPSVILTDCHLDTHVAIGGFRSYLQNHHVLVGLLFVGVMVRKRREELTRRR